MSLAVIHSRASLGINAPLISVEAHLSKGLPSFSIVGLPETSVKESKDRVRAAIQNAGFEFPKRRITINLAPADLPKDGSRFDLAIALGLLAASGQIPSPRSELVFIAELALSGGLRSVKGVLPAALQCLQQQEQLLVAKDNADEAALATGLAVFAAESLSEVCAFLSNQQPLTPHQVTAAPQPALPAVDLQDIKGQEQAKRCLLIAAAGRHNLLMVGPPGTGKTLLANRLPELLPDLNQQQAIASLAIRSLRESIQVNNGWQRPPYRQPHHTASAVALVGGGTHPKPGEISLAHEGVLFLDELTEFPRHALDSLRQPLESGTITIARSHHHAEFPADIQLLAAMNPCPAGRECDFRDNCQCSPEQQKRYWRKLSMPLMDRIDLQILVPRIRPEELRQLPAGAENSQQAAQRIAACQQRQHQRQGKLNARLTIAEIETHCALDAKSQHLIEQAMERFSLSMRSYHRLLKIARTIADLAARERIQPTDIAEALNYRVMERAMQQVNR